MESIQPLLMLITLLVSMQVILMTGILISLFFVVRLLTKAYEFMIKTKTDVNQYKEQVKQLLIQPSKYVMPVYYFLQYFMRKGGETYGRQKTT
jgi:hypothetical protein